LNYKYNNISHITKNNIEFEIIRNLDKDNFMKKLLLLLKEKKELLVFIISFLESKIK